MHKKNNVLRALTILNEIIWYTCWSLAIIMPLIILIGLSAGFQEAFISAIEIDTPLSFLLKNYSSFSAITISIFLLIEIEIFILFGFYITRQFRKLFQQLKIGNIFTEKNVIYINRIAYASLIFIVITLNISGLFLALILLLFAQIFAYGVHLEKERKLTI